MPAGCSRAGNWQLATKQPDIGNQLGQNPFLHAKPYFIIIIASYSFTSLAAWVIVVGYCGHIIQQLNVIINTAVDVIKTPSPGDPECLPAGQSVIVSYT